jgi:hypothetical protein
MGTCPRTLQAGQWHPIFAKLEKAVTTTRTIYKYLAEIAKFGLQIST